MEMVLLPVCPELPHEIAVYTLLVAGQQLFVAIGDAEVIHLHVPSVVSPARVMNS